MSIIVFIAPWLAGVTCVAVWLILRFFLRKYPSKWLSWSERALPIAIFPFAFFGYFFAMDNTMTETGRNVTPQVANESLGTFDVPDTATAVDFRHSLSRGTIDEANFTIAEEDFLDWIKSEGREIHEFYTDENGFHWTKPRPSWVPDWISVSPIHEDGEEYEFVKIKNGYRFRKCDEEHRDACFSVTYDKDTRRAYVWRSRF